MKNHSLIIFVSAVLMLASATAAASPSDDAYYAEMEKMAAEADIAETRVQSTEDGWVDVGAGLVAIRKNSPTAFVAYKGLRPAYKAEIRKAIRNGQETFAVIELIFSRNNLMGNR
ncbi:hypothetical protein [Thiolapillus sp.]|uniref:hypothetical protein n=4 Tax=Thiolapillus sp. TaxID=2017437 RepID=UPI0025ED0C9A|nr:hypothetical protein [Thiolapillus sp.]